MTRGAYNSLASRYHLKALLHAREFWDMYSQQGKLPVGVRTRTDVIIFRNKMELHVHIARCRENIRRYMNEKT